MKRVLTIVFALTVIIGVSSVNSPAQTGYNCVLEYCTGTWCQWCPCAETIIDGIKQNYPNTVVLGYHGPTGSDPWASYGGQTMISYFGFNAYPTGIVARQTGIIDRGGWNNRVAIYSTALQPGVSIAVNNWNYNSGTHTVTANIVCTALTTLNGNYYLMMELTEDNIVYPQTGNTSCPGSGAFVHKYVLKGLINGSTGTLLATTDNWTQGNSVTTPLNYTFPAGVVDNNCNINLFVYTGGGNPSLDGAVQQATLFPAATGPTGITNQNTTPEKYNLSQNYPNPFNPTTNIHFSLPKDGNTSLKIYDVLGHVVDTYVDGFMKAGTYNAEIDASNWASGIYFYTLSAGNFVETKKMTLVK